MTDKLIEEPQIENLSEESVKHIKQALDRLDENVAVDATIKLSALLVELHPNMAGKSALAAAYYFNNPPVTQKEAAAKFRSTTQTVQKYCKHLSMELEVDGKDFQADKGIRTTRLDLVKEIADKMDWDKGVQHNITDKPAQTKASIKKKGLEEILELVSDSYE